MDLLLLCLTESAFFQCRAQMRDALLGVGQGRRFLRILLRFQDSPAGIAVQFLEDRNVIDDAVAGYSIDAEIRAFAEDRIQKTPVAGYCLVHLLLAYVLAMNMGDPRFIAPRQIARISAAPSRMARIEQKIRRRLGMGHESVDVVERLHDRAHVMMIAELKPLSGEKFSKFRDLCTIARPIA